MTLTGLPTVGTLSNYAGNFLAANPALVQQLAGDALTNVIKRYVKKSVVRKGVSRRVMRKALNRKRRWFVDNIIMHHKRLHDRNRAIAVSDARSRALNKRNNRNLVARNNQSQNFQQREQERHSQNPSESIKSRSETLKERVSARKTRARSRWISMMNESSST